MGLFGKGEANILGTELQPCSTARPNKNGFSQSAMRDGYCFIPKEEETLHSKLTVCVQMTEEFMEFSKTHGTDFSAPEPAYDFPGLTAGDRWCICARKWAYALAMNKAPKIKLDATHISIRSILDLNDIKSFGITHSNLFEQ